MKALVQERERAIEMRKKGSTYNEILNELTVAKSSLSLWLKDLPLTKSEKLVLKNRTNENISRGRIKVAGILRQKRLKREEIWFQEAKTIFSQFKNEPFFNVGVALYWAEGAKRVNQWSFSNSDHDMILLMVNWLERYCEVDRLKLFYRLYIHKPYAHEDCESWWAKKLNAQPIQFVKTVYKPSGLGVKKRPVYKGCLKIEVRKSKGLLCKMKFWQNMLIETYRKE